MKKYLVPFLIFFSLLLLAGKEKEAEEVIISTFQQIVNTLRVVVNCSKDQWNSNTNNVNDDDNDIS